MAQRILVILVAVSAAVGFSFAAVSTSDFVAHLDRQVHGIHCSFLPGVDAPDVTGSSGCHVTLMSPYSSVLRDRVWGGIPISLPAMAIFAYLAFFALALLVIRRTEDVRATAFLALGTAVPLLTSIVMGWIALRELDAACKLCIGIYASSSLAFLFALVAWARAYRSSRAMALHGGGATTRGAHVRSFDAIELEGDADRTIPADQTLDDADSVSLGTADTIHAPPGRRLATASEMDARLGRGRPARAARARPTDSSAPIGWGELVGAFVLGLFFVSAPVVAYAAGAPEFDRFLGACGTLAHPADPNHVLVPLGPQTRAVQVIEVLDPLCPACRGFERRFAELPAAEQTSRRVLLFPLDDACNWMVDRAIHPGACAVSEAVLCAADDADEVISWAFDEQEAIRTATERDPEAAARMARERFPSLRSCIGSPEVRARLNRALRWAVSNQLPVLTPQVYVGETRVCDADTDLGLDWTLTHLLERQGGSR